MHEELWQALVAPALVRSMNLRAECLFHEVPTREGSRADLVYAVDRRLVVFEMKKGDEGEASCSLGPRAARQLRHFKAAANSVYLVTVSGPRNYTLGHDGAVVLLDPLEAQVLPPGVGWIAFDRLSHEATILVPAPELAPKSEDRQFVVDHLLARVSQATRHLKALRAAV